MLCHQAVVVDQAPAAGWVWIATGEAEVLSRYDMAFEDPLLATVAFCKYDVPVCRGSHYHSIGAEEHEGMWKT